MAHKQEEMIVMDHVAYIYPQNDREEESKPALKDLSVRIKKGEFVGIIGHNGSGKSTLAKLLNGIIMPIKGDVIIGGFNTKDEEHLWDIRKTAGMVFQNPDNQLVSTIVEEDVAFGPENLGIPTEEIRQRVDHALSMVSMSGYKKHQIHRLSGGQKQRIAIAGILAMEPACMIFDEPTAMLDPVGRHEVMYTIKKLNREKGLTVIHITHDMTELTESDRIIVMNDGVIEFEGTPRNVFSQVDRLKQLQLEVPPMTELAHRLRKQGLNIPDGIMTAEELAEVLGC